MFPFLTVFLIFLIWLAYRIRKAKSSRQKKIDDFWEKEHAADLVPPKDLGTLHYVTIPLDTFPLGEVYDPEVEMIEDELRELSTGRMLNLSGMLNADIKSEYGAANLDAVVPMGDRFERMTLLLVDYAKALIEAGRTDAAVTVLEYGKSVGSDISSNYTLLADCYKGMGSVEKLDSLISYIEAGDLPRKQHILDVIRAE